MSSFAARGAKSNLCEAFLSLDPYTLGSSEGMDLVNTFMGDIARFEVVRNDLSFRIMLQINEKLEED